MPQPLAFRMRPKHLSDVIGQEKIVGPDGFLSNSVKNGMLFSLILYGGPGTGKSTIAECYAREMNVKWIKINAVTSNKKEIDAALEECSHYENAFLIVDEVHRLNKDKQEILLPYVEEGKIYLIGCTTENPYFAINKAIRSRCHLLEVKPLTNDEIIIGLRRALSSPKGLNNQFQVEDKGLEYIANMTGGDLRYALNYLEVISLYPHGDIVTLDDIKQILKVPNYQMDKDEDEYYDSLSALQKSIRGSDVDAALYYLARLCVAEDLVSLKRRLLVIAYEDIGLANPAVVDRAYHALHTAEEVGFPEAIIPLGFIVCELALSPKSKASCKSIQAAMGYASEHPLPVMDYLKLTPVNVKEEDKYPYDRPDLWAKIQYLPELIKDMKFYQENPNPSSYEKVLNENYEKLKSVGRSSNLRALKKKQ